MAATCVVFHAHWAHPAYSVTSAGGSAELDVWEGMKPMDPYRPPCPLTSPRATVKCKGSRYSDNSSYTCPLHQVYCAGCSTDLI